MPRHSNEIVDLEVRLYHQTAKARLISLPGQDQPKKWAPKQLTEYWRQRDDGNYDMSLPEWLAVEKRLI